MQASILSARLERIRPSASVAAKARVTQLVRDGRDIVDFTVGEPDLATPPNIIEAAHQAALRGETRYTPTTGTLALRQAVQRKFRHENALSFELNQLVVGCGAKHIIFSALTATVDEGDEVIVPAPYWVSYPDMVRFNGGTPVIVPCPEAVGFKLTPAALDGAITARTKWLILNAPGNPSGAVYSRQELAALAAVLECHPHVWVLTDEIYEHLNYGDTPCPSLAAVNPAIGARTLTVNGVSKAYAMTGWRIGYAGGPASLIKAIDKLMSQSTGGACSVSQAAAVEALSGPQAFVADARQIFAQRRDRITYLMNQIPGIRCAAPQGAFYVFPSCAGLLGKTTPDGKILGDDLEVSMYLLEVAGVAVLDGRAYGLSPHLRLSFATSMDRIEEGCRRIAAACAMLR